MWHPHEPILAYAISEDPSSQSTYVIQPHQVLLHNVRTGKRQQVAMLPDTAFRCSPECRKHGGAFKFMNCTLECWSCCGQLFCFTYQSEMAKTLVVAKADGSGTLFSLSPFHGEGAVLSCASIGLMSVLDTSRAKEGPYQFAVYDINAGTLVRTHSMQATVYGSVGMQAEFLLGGPIIAFSAKDFMADAKYCKLMGCSTSDIPRPTDHAGNVFPRV